jgi:CHASE3 domain sensor protein
MVLRRRSTGSLFMSKLPFAVRSWRRILRFWHSRPVRAQGGILSIIPIIAVLVSFFVAIYGNRSRAWIESDIQRKFQMVRQYNDLLTLMVDAETGERGFLITRRPEYLEPYQKAVVEIPNTLVSLRQTIEAEPGENPRNERLAALNQLDSLIAGQLASLKDSQEFTRQNKSGDELYAHLQGGKDLMDSIRSGIGTMQNKEEQLLSERISEINYIRYRDYIFLFGALLVGLLTRIVSFYLFDRGIVQRVNRLTENTRKILDDQPLLIVPQKKEDAIGLLEQEIVKIAERKNLGPQDGPENNRRI